MSFLTKLLKIQRGPACDIIHRLNQIAIDKEGESVTTFCFNFLSLSVFQNVSVF